MYTYTTPGFTFVLPDDASNYPVFRITFSQDDKTILTFTQDDCEIEGEKIRLRLTQSQSGIFTPDMNAWIEFRAMNLQGQVETIEAGAIMVKKSQNQEILTLPLIPATEKPDIISKEDEIFVIHSEADKTIDLAINRDPCDCTIPIQTEVK